MSLRYRLFDLPVTFDEFHDRVDRVGVDAVRIGQYGMAGGLTQHEYCYAAHTDHAPALHDSRLVPILSRDIYLHRPEEFRFNYPREEREKTLEDWETILSGDGIDVTRVDVTYR